MLAWKAAGKVSQGLPVMGQRAEHAEKAVVMRQVVVSTGRTK